MFLNDGEYIYRNEYRPNNFCEERAEVYLERDRDTMIGNELIPRTS